MSYLSRLLYRQKSVNRNTYNLHIIYMFNVVSLTDTQSLEIKMHISFLTFKYIQGPDSNKKLVMKLSALQVFNQHGYNAKDKKVQVGNDQEMTRSERTSHSKN